MHLINRRVYVIMTYIIIYIIIATSFLTAVNIQQEITLMKAFENLWAAAVERLSEHISKQAMDLWIRPIIPVSYVDFCAVLLVDSSFQRDIIMSKYKDLINSVLSDMVGFEMSINVITPEERSPSSSQKRPEKPKVEIESLVEPIYPEYTFNTFVVGESNKHAYAACSAVAKNPAKAYNPLFIYGNTGLGKTHLLKAIRNEIAVNFPSYKTIYITGEEFTNELIENIRNKTMPEFKNKYRSIDVLFVDDIQFIANKDSTQEEFFHTFNALYEANKQIVLASDRPPRDIALLENRLRSRFEMGIITDIYLPEYELKVAIIKQKATTYGLDLPDDVVDFIAMKIKNNIRQIEGVLKKIMAFQLISNLPPSISVASSAVKDITSENEPTPVVFDKVIKEISREFNVSEEDILSKKRMEAITFARQIAMYVMREVTDLSLPEIGQTFNGRDHSTVHHAIHKIDEKIKTNPALKSRIDTVIKNVKEL